MYIIKELFYGLNLSKEENKDFLLNLMENDIQVVNTEVNGHCDFPYHGGQTSFDVPSFHFGIFIDNDDGNDRDLAEVLMEAMKEEDFYKEQYDKFKVEVLDEIEEIRSWAKEEQIGEYFTEEKKQTTLKTLRWLEGNINKEEPTFYFSESSS